MASEHLLSASRLPAVFATVARNRQWWTTGPLLSYGQRVSFTGSRIVWEYYPGQGIEIQWLATFSEGNGYYLSGKANVALRELLDEIIPLAAERAGGIAWEYLFHFDGGSPPWTSGLSQGTALQVLARAATRFHEPLYLTAAERALAIFKVAPPAGVRVPTAVGANYLEYTFAPSDRILNGFIQAVIGLYDYTKLTGDPVGEQLFEAGDAEARIEVPHYDTGYWSMYDQYSESDLNYHELLTEFLQHLCTRTDAGLPLPPASPPAPESAPPGSPAGNAEAGGGTAGAGTSSTGATGAGGGTPSAGTSPSVTPAPAQPIADIYCTSAESFTADLKTPPAVLLLTTQLPDESRGGVRISLSKVATVRLTVRHGNHTVWVNSATVEHGQPRLLWVTPPTAGSYAVTLRAVDLAGNVSTAAGTIAIVAPHKVRRPQRVHAGHSLR
jgi:D-glucuronyl C5-epimerase C-terminus